MIAPVTHSSRNNAAPGGRYAAEAEAIAPGSYDKSLTSTSKVVQLIGDYPVVAVGVAATAGALLGWVIKRRLQ